MPKGFSKPLRSLCLLAWRPSLVIRLVLGSLGVGIAGIFLISAITAWIITHPPQESQTQTQLDIDVGWVRFDFPTRDGATLAGWFGPVINPIGTVILAHGVTGSHQDLIGKAHFLRRAGYNAFVFDFLGHGLSDSGVVSLGAHEVKDLLAAVDLVVRLPGVDPTRVAVLGDSMGGAVAIMAAARDPRIAAVVAESSYARLDHTMSESFDAFLQLPAFPFAGPVQFFGRMFSGVDVSEVNPVNEIGRISPRPVFIIHGGSDNQIPAQTGRELHDAAREPRVIWQPARVGHVAAFHSRFDYGARVNAFLGQALGRLNVSLRGGV
jgi:dipeptidyl aminopeptidase/acylaminoacyl peptidase